ncbi:MAG: aldo/keto reductase [Candidatus Zixiibacteriota bacterium]|nr:MAG: aldo/keto reductase [candidate division Zixibacteria bacterium]
MMTPSDSEYTRRKFLATAATGLVSAGVLSLSPGAAAAQTSKEESSTASGRIVHRTLGRTGINLPVVSMGVMNAGNPEVVQASFELGVRHFDTAAYYQFGRNEQMVGSVIGRLGARNETIIGTKILTPQQRTGLSYEALKAKTISSCEASLGRLKMEHVDILYIHDVRDSAPLNDPGIIDGLTELKKQGKVRSTGVATHAAMADVINGVVAGGFFDVVLTAINFTMADDANLLAAVRNAGEKGVGIVAMKTLAGGARWPNPASRQDYTSSTITTAALKWVLRTEGVSTSIPGYTNYEHMREDFSVAYDLEYTDEERSFLSDNSIRLGMGFCRQCRSCLAACPDKVDIPGLMRTHMYAAQYGNLFEARATLDALPAERGLKKCIDCSTCVARCAHSVDIAGRIDELKTLYC